MGLLGLGKYGDLELSIDFDKKNRIYFNIDTRNMYMYFLTDIQEEDRLLKVIISFLKNDGDVVWGNGIILNIGKFGNSKVSLVKDEGRIVVLLQNGQSCAMRYDIPEGEFLIACENLYKDLQ